MKNLSGVLILTILIAFAVGCSSGGVSDITQPDGQSRITNESLHQLWGYWQFIADPDSATLDIIPLRETGMHLNALKFLEPPALTYLTIENLEFSGGTIDVDVGLRHPFLGLNIYTGFDVAGILISHGSVSKFSDPDINMPGENDTRLMNPDGLTRWWNPSEFPVNDGSMFCYQDGILGEPQSSANYDATLNGYKFFCDDLEANDALDQVSIDGRAIFSAGQKNTRHYTIHMGSSFSFNYAVDASWKHPVGSPPWDVPDDFPPDANRPEAWRISVTEIENTLYNELGIGGGQVRLSVDVYDHFNADMNIVRVEAPGEIPVTESSSPSGGGYGFSTYEVDIFNCTPMQPGELDLLITIESEKSGYGGLLPDKPVSAYFIHTTTVDDEAPQQGKWSREFIVKDWDSCYPVMTQSATGRLVASWATNPGLGWAEFEPPDLWKPPLIITDQIVPIRMSMSPAREGDEIYIDTLDYAGTEPVAGVPVAYGHTMAYRWDGAYDWDEWDTTIFINHHMSQIFIDFEGKIHFFQGSSHNYGFIQHCQCSTWKMSGHDYYPYDSYSTSGGNEHEVAYSRCVDDDSNGYMYMVFESDRNKSTFWPPEDYRWLRITKQYLPSTEYNDFETVVIDEGDMDYLDSPCVAVDLNDIVHVVYRRYIDALERWQIVHRWSDDGLTWSDANESIVWDDPMQPEWRYISIDVDSMNRLHVTFRAGAKVLYTRSDDFTTWIPYEWVNESIDGIVGVGDHQPWMFVDSDDQVHVVWTRLPVIPDPKFGAIRHRWREP